MARPARTPASGNRRWPPAALEFLSGTRRAGWVAALLAASASAAPLDDLRDAAEARLAFRWYRLEVVVFERPDAERGAARQRRLASLALPRLPIALTEAAPPSAGAVFGARARVAAPTPVLLVDLPPPRWFGGPCASARAPPGAPDPCLWRPRRVDLEAYFGDDPTAPLAVPGLPPVEDALALAAPATSTPAPAEREAQIRAELAAMLDAGFSEHEQALYATSYEWHRRAPELGAAARRLGRRYPVLAVGSWHQPVPPRNAPQPVLVRLAPLSGVDHHERVESARGAPGRARLGDAAPVLDGWFTVTVGRYIHFEASLRRHRADGGVALLAERRAMRSEETHYLDHPALGVLVRATPLAVPTDLLRLLDDLRALNESAATEF